LGALSGKQIATDVYAYEGPFGVGYLVAKVRQTGEDSGMDLLKDYSNQKNVVLEQLRRNESDCVKLARETLETFVKEKRKIAIPQWLPMKYINRQAGVFVSLKKEGQLRGCIGTIGATQKNIAGEIIHNAISAGTQDPRFEEIREEELPELVYSVDILGTPEKIESLAELDAQRYGVIVTSGNRRGLLLPNLEGVETPEKQVEIALQKAGINPFEGYGMERFEVTRYH